jgi:hypothetical protein
MSPTPDRYADCVGTDNGRALWCRLDVQQDVGPALQHAPLQVGRERPASGVQHPSRIPALGFLPHSKRLVQDRDRPGHAPAPDEVMCPAASGSKQSQITCERVRAAGPQPANSRALSRWPCSGRPRSFQHSPRTSSQRREAARRKQTAPSKASSGLCRVGGRVRGGTRALTAPFWILCQDLDSDLTSKTLHTLDVTD